MAPPIAILGGGPAGLTLGRLLHLANIDFVIFEREESASKAFNRGGTLDLHTDSGQLALKEAGLYDEFKARARHNVTNKIADSQGTIFMEPDGEGEDKPEIDRKDLRMMLLRSVPEEKVRWASKIQSVKKDSNNGSVSVHFTDGSAETGFRLVVGADGAWSKARALVTSATPKYHNMTFLAASVKPSNAYYPTAESLAGGGNYIALGGGRGIIITRLGDDTYYAGIALPLSEDWATKNAALLDDADALRDDLLKEFSEWPARHTDLIKYCEGGYYPWPQYSLDPSELEWNPVPGVTLVGDAAHLTVTDGVGVNAAMFDSFQLSQQIISHGLEDLDSAVAAYEKEMLERSRERLAGSIVEMKMWFSEGSPQSFLQAMAAGEDGP